MKTTRRCLCKLWSRTFVAPLHTPFVLSARRILVLYKVAMLMQAPYYFQEAQIEAAIATMDVAPEYADIRQVESSTAVLYLFSERFMTYGKAYGLCEWFEVEQFQNP